MADTQDAKPAKGVWIKWAALTLQIQFWHLDILREILCQWCLCHFAPAKLEGERPASRHHPVSFTDESGRFSRVDVIFDNAPFLRFLRLFAATFSDSAQKALAHERWSQMLKKSC